VSGNSGFVSFRAVGTTSPRWELWLADRIIDTGALDSAYEAARALSRVVTDIRDRGADRLEADLAAVQKLIAVGATSLDGTRLDFRDDIEYRRPRWAPLEILRVGMVETGPVSIVEPGLEQGDVDDRTKVFLSRRRWSLGG